MGATGSKSQRLEKALGPSFPDTEHCFGLENFGNTCYCNSVLQALFHCMPMRERCLEHCANMNSADDDLLACLCDLFRTISSQKKRCGVHAPRRFVGKLRHENELFNNHQHQDAHEFLNYLLNEAAELLEKQNKQKQGASAGGSSGSDGGSGDDSDAGSSSSDAQRRRKPYKPKTWIHSIFEGVLTSETRCLCCESVTSRDECFLDLSLEVEQNSSVSACMRNFSAPESLRDDNKFYCDTCCSLQEAKKCIRIKHLPNVLALHLKRFKYIEQLQRFKKLSYRISFPMELNLPNIAEAADNPDRTYRLFAVVVHVGSGPNHGHYISLVRSHQHWLLFDDESVDVIEEASIQSCFGSAVDTAANTDTGYILFYQATDWDSSGEEEQPPPGRPPGPERPPGRRSPPKSAGAKDVGL